MQRVTDLYVAYDILKRLVTPFDKMDAYKLGIIDKDGNFLKKRKEFTDEEKKKVTRLDTIIINLKKIAGKFLPGKAASYAAALALLRESTLNEMDDNALFECAELIYEGEFLTEDAQMSSSSSVSAGSGNINLDPIIKQDKHSITYRANKNTFSRCIRGKCKKERFDEYIEDENLLTNVRGYAKNNPYNSIILQDEETGSKIFLKYGKHGSWGIPPRG